jgi:hypothetical protein
MSESRDDVSYQKEVKENNSHELTSSEESSERIRLQNKEHAFNNVDETTNSDHIIISSVVTITDTLAQPTEVNQQLSVSPYYMDADIDSACNNVVDDAKANTEEQSPPDSATAATTQSISPSTEERGEELVTEQQPQRRSTRSSGPLVDSPRGDDDIDDEDEDEEEEEEEEEHIVEDEEKVIRDMVDTLLGRVEGRWSIVDEGKPFDFPAEGLCYVPLQLTTPPKYKGELDEVRNIMWPCWLITEEKKNHLLSTNCSTKHKEEGDDGEDKKEDQFRNKSINEGDDELLDAAKPRLVVSKKRNEASSGEACVDSATPCHSSLRTVCCYGDGRFLEIDEAYLLPFEDNEVTVAAKAQADDGGVLWREATKQADARMMCPDDFTNMVSQNIEYCAAPVLIGRLWATEKVNKP